MPLSNRHRIHQRRTRHLFLEPLEDRRLLATMYAVDDAVSTSMNMWVEFGVLGNDYTDTQEPFWLDEYGQPSNGSLSSGPNGSFIYTPNLGFSGTDSFWYVAETSWDGDYYSGIATVTIEVASADDFYSTSSGTQLTVSAPGVLANDYDPDGYPAPASLVSGTAYGSLNLNTDSGFTYTPSGPFVSDSFTYSSGTGASTVTITSDDTPTSGFWSPTNAADMVKTVAYAFDGGQVGDSLLTSFIETVVASTSTTRTTAFAYDFRGRRTLTTLPDPDGTGISYSSSEYETEYDNLGRVITQVDALDKETTYAYDDDDRKLMITQPATAGYGTVDTVKTYNSRGLPASLLDPSANLTSWQFDGAARVTKETNPLGYVRTYAYNGVGNLTERIDRLGRKTTYEYDKANRNTFEKWYDGTTLLKTISFGYDDAGWLEEASGPSGTYDYLYDRLGRLATEDQDIAGLMTDGGLTPDVRYVSQYNGRNARTQLQAQIGGTDDFKNTYLYDELTRLESIRQQGVGGGNTLAEKRTDFTYNSAGQFDKIARYADVAGTDFVANTLHRYDQAGRLTKLQHTMLSTMPSSGFGTGALAGYEYSYDDNSRIGSINSMADGSFAYTYDDADQLTGAASTSYSQSDEYYTYDANGTRGSSNTNNQMSNDGTYIYSYDREGNRITRFDISLNPLNLYQYDHRNRLVAVQDLEPGVPLEDDNTGWGWGSNSFAVDPSDPGPSWGSRTGGGSYWTGSANRSFTASVTALPEGRMVVLTLTVSSGSVTDLVVTTESHTATDTTDYVPSYYSPVNGNTRTMYFLTVDDTLNEGLESFKIHVEFNGQPLTKATLEADIIDDDGSFATNQWAASVDANGSESGGATALVLQASANLTFEYYLENVSAQLGIDFLGATLTPTSWTPVTVPANGSSAVYFPMLQDGVLEMRESFKIHVRIAGQSGTEHEIEADIIDNGFVEVSRIEYDYDFSNLLVRRSADDDGIFGENDPTDTFYSWDANQIALEFDGDAAADLAHRYLWGPAIDQLLTDEAVTSLTSAGEVRWALGDHLGTIRDIATHNNSTHATTVVNHRQYGAFGNLISETNSAIALSFGFTGAMYDAETNLQYNHNRWYDSATGQWMTEDPIGFAGDPSNLYRYVGNSPVDSTDPSGLESRGPSSLSIFLQDYQYFVDPAAMPAKADFLSYCAVGGKYIGWGAFYGAGTAAIMIQTGGVAGIFPGGAGTIYVGGGGLGAGTVAAGSIGATAGTAVSSTGAAGQGVMLANGGSAIGWVYQGGVWVQSAPITSHHFLGTKAGLVVNNQAIAGATAYTVCKSGGEIHVMGSQNFGGSSSLTPQVIEIIKQYYK